MSHRDPATVAWRDSPDPFRPLMIPIYTAKVGKPVTVVVIVPSLVGVYTHYVDDRTRPCVSPALPCEGCERKIDRRWRGYAGSWDWHKGRLCLAEVTTEAYSRCGSFQEYKDRLRGLVLRLDRNGQSKNSRVTARLSTWTGPAGELPPAFNVRETLERIWWQGGGGQLQAELDRPPPGDEGGARVVATESSKPEGPYAR